MVLFAFHYYYFLMHLFLQSVYFYSLYNGNYLLFSCYVKTNRYKKNYCVFINCTYEFCVTWFILFNFQAVSGSIFLMISHGLVSSGLFLCIGFLYERYHSRLFFYYNGLFFLCHFLQPLFLYLFQEIWGFLERVVLLVNF